MKGVLKENIPFYSIIVFAGNCKLEDISFIPKNTFVTKSYMVVEVIENIMNNNPVANYNDKRKVINILSKAVNNGQNNDVTKKHISNIKEMLGEDKSLSSRLFVYSMGLAAAASSLGFPPHWRTSVRLSSLSAPLFRDSSSHHSE